MNRGPAQSMSRGFCLLAGLAALVTLLLYPRALDNFQRPASDEVAIEAARALLARLGMEPGSLRFTVRRLYSENRYRRSSAFRGTAWAGAVTATEILVTARQGEGDGWMEITLSEAMRPLAWEAKGLAPTTVEAGRAWLAALAGEQASCFAGNPERKQDVLRWTCPVAGSASVDFTVELDDGKPREARLTPKPPRGRDPGWNGLTDVAKGVAAVVAMVLVPAALYWTFSKRKRHRDHLKAAFRVALLFLLMCLLMLLAGLFREESTKDSVLVVLGQPEVLLLALAPGFMLVRGWQVRSWLGACRLARWRIWDRRVGHEILSGLLLGPVVACAATLCALLPGALPAAIPLDRLFDLYPFVSAVVRFPTSGFLPLLFLGVFAPWVLRSGYGSRGKRIAVSACAVCFVAAGLEPVAGNGYANLLASGAIAVLLWRAYVSIGLLAVCAAIPAAAAVPGIALALVQGGAVRETLCYGAVLGVAFLARRYGSSADLDALEEEIERRNAPPAEEFRSERERLLAEVALAREAQQALLPAAPPALNGYRVAAVCQPAGEIGGDFYDYLPFGQGRIAFCVADVSGKGVTASVYNTFAKGMLTALARRDLPLAELAATLNHEFLDAARRKTFITLVMALLEPGSRRVEILRLGHNPPLLHRRSSGEMIWLRPPGLGVGLASSLSLRRIVKVESVQLEPGDTLVLYSDGLTEAMTPEQDVFGEDRLVAAVGRHAARDAVGLRDALLGEVEAFRAGAEPNDDLTLLVIRASGNGA